MHTSPSLPPAQGAAALNASEPCTAQADQGDPELPRASDATNTPIATCSDHIPRSLSRDVFETARQMVRTYAGGLGGKTGPCEALASSLFQLLAEHRGEELFALKHAAEATVPYSDPAWTACSLLAMGTNHVAADAVAAFRALQRRELQALAPRARARVASVALLFDVDDTLTPALQDTSFPSVQAYPGLRAVVRRLAMRCAATGHLLRVGCLTARPGWLAWAVGSALRTAFHMPALVPEQHDTKKGHTQPVNEQQHRAMGDIAAADIADGLAGDSRHAGLGSCDLLTGRLRDSLRIRSNSRNSAIAHTKSMNFQAFARMHPECVVVFCGDSGQGDAITALQMQKEALVQVQWDISTPKATPATTPSITPVVSPQESPAALTPDAQMVLAAAAASASISQTPAKRNWLCYACCGVIHDIVGLGSSGKQVPSTSALERARQRAQGVHIFDSYVEVAGVLGALLPLLLAPRPGTGEPVWRTVDTDAVALAAVRDMHVPADSVIKHAHTHGAVTVGHLWARDASASGSTAAVDALHASTSLSSPLPPPQTAGVASVDTHALSEADMQRQLTTADTKAPASSAMQPSAAQLRVMRDLFNDAGASPAGGNSPLGARRTNSFDGTDNPHTMGGSDVGVHDDSALASAGRGSMRRTHSDGLSSTSAPPGAPVFETAASIDEAEARSLHAQLQQSTTSNSSAQDGGEVSPVGTLTGLPAGVAVALPPPTAVSGVGASPEAIRVQHSRESAFEQSRPESAERLGVADTAEPLQPAVSPPSLPLDARPPPIAVAGSVRSAGERGGVGSRSGTNSSTLSRGTSFGDRLRQGVSDTVLQEVYSWAKAYPSISAFKFGSKVQGEHRLQELRVAMDTWCSWGGAGAHCSQVALCEQDADGNCSAWVAPPPAHGMSVSALVQLDEQEGHTHAPVAMLTPTPPATTATEGFPVAVPRVPQMGPGLAHLHGAGGEGIDVPSTRGTVKAITGPSPRS